MTDGSRDDQAQHVEPTTVSIPLWLARLAAVGWRVLVILGLVAVSAWIAFTIGTVTASVAVAAVAAAALMPAVRSLRARGLGANAAAALGTVAVFGAIVGLLGLVAVVLVADGPSILAQVRDGVDAIENGEGAQDIPPEILASIGDLIDDAASWLGDNAGAIVGNVGTAATIMLFGAFTTFYLLASDFGWWRWITQDLDPSRRTVAARIAETGVDRLASYVRTTSALAAVEALVDLVLLLVLGVPLAIPLAVLVFIAGFIPYLGGLVANLVLLLAALAALGPGGAILLLVLLVVAAVLEEWLIGRRLQRASPRVSPALPLLALPVGAYLAGLFGLIMAVPVAVLLLATLQALGDELDRRSGDAIMADGLVPVWLELLAAWSWRLLVGIALVAVLVAPIVAIPLVALPLIIAAALAAPLATVVGGLVQRGWSRTMAAASATAGLTVVIVGVTTLAVASLTSSVDDIARGMDEGARSADDSLGGLGGLLAALSDSVGSGSVEAVLAVTSRMAGVSVIALIGVILAFVALRDGPRTWTRLTGRLAPWRRDELDKAASQAVGVLSGYMLGTGAVSLFGAGTQWLLMVVLGIPLALPVFVLAFLGGYIPYFGSAITTFMADLLALSTGDAFTLVVFVGFTLVFNVVQGNIVQPLVFSRAVNIHPAVALLAIPAGGAIAGILGMFLVVPFIGVVAAIWRSLLAVMGTPATGAYVAPAGPATAGSGATVPANVSIQDP
jgi:predicted PurR-regulated permease PerM